MNSVMNLRVPYMQGISRIAEKLLASQDGAGRNCVSYLDNGLLG
jgi:hypothetical protein